jgi:hypothetical protein
MEKDSRLAPSYQTLTSKTEALFHFSRAILALFAVILALTSVVLAHAGFISLAVVVGSAGIGVWMCFFMWRIVCDLHHTLGGFEGISTGEGYVLQALNPQQEEKKS